MVVVVAQLSNRGAMGSEVIGQIAQNLLELFLAMRLNLGFIRNNILG